MPDNKIYVIDLTASPPTQIGTIEAGKQASGMAIGGGAAVMTVIANVAEPLNLVAVPTAAFDQIREDERFGPLRNFKTNNLTSPVAYRRLGRMSKSINSRPSDSPS